MLWCIAHLRQAKSYMIKKAEEGWALNYVFFILFEFNSVYDFCCCVLHPIIKSYFYDACNSVASYISDKIYITRKAVRRNIIQFTSFQGTKTTYVRILCHNNNVFKVSERIQSLSPFSCPLST